MDLRSKISKILDEFAKEKETPFKKNDLAATINKGLDDVLSKDFLPENYETHGSAGKGRWATIPWLGVFNKDINNSPQRGFDIVYLFSINSNYVYLSLNQGWTFYNKNYTAKLAKNNIRQVSEYILSKIFIPSPRMLTLPINLTEGEKITGTNLPKGYELSNILSIKYSKENLPSNDVMLSDLHDMITALEQIKSLLIFNNLKDNINHFLSNNVKNDDFSSKASIINDSAKINNNTFLGRKIDYLDQNIHKADIGLKGEKMVLTFEHKKLEKYSSYSKQIKHISQEEGDGMGYDIKSCQTDGNPLYIEVKTTTGDKKSPFFITPNELKASKIYRENYIIFRIYDFNENTNIKNLKYYLLAGDLTNNSLVKLEPSQFKATVKINNPK